MNLEISKAVNDNLTNIDPLVLSSLNNVAASISEANNLNEAHGSNQDTAKFFEQALDDVDKSLYMPENGHAAPRFLQNITDDLALAKFEVDTNGDETLAKLVQQALEDVAVSKFLNNMV